MNDDEPGYVARLQARQRLYIGRDMTNEELVTEWSRSDIHQRVAVLEEIAKEPMPTTIDKASAELTQRRLLRDQHERLRRSGR